MVVIRPVTLNDLDQLLVLTTLTGYGLTTLPRDRELLRKRILKSQRSFAGMGEQPGGEIYLFVLTEPDTGRIVGTSGIVSKVGGFEPFYGYRVETSVHESAFLGVRKEIRTLHLVAEHDGPCEIGSLFLAPDYRKDGNGRLLSLCRFLFMAEHAPAFDPTVIAEIRGIIDGQGRSPFWDAVGKHFFDIDFPKADYLSMVNKKFIADLMPKHPIYVPLLPEEAQKVIGQVHEQSRPAMKILEEEGFKFSGFVEIFEAGPTIVCPLSEIRTACQSRKAVVADVSDAPVESEVFMVANTSPEFRACKGHVVEVPGGVRLPRDCADALHVSKGQPVRFAPLRPASKDPLAEIIKDPAAAVVAATAPAAADTAADAASATGAAGAATPEVSK